MVSSQVGNILVNSQVDNITWSVFEGWNQWYSEGKGTGGKIASWHPCFHFLENWFFKKIKYELKYGQEAFQFRLK